MKLTLLCLTLSPYFDLPLTYTKNTLNLLLFFNLSISHSHTHTHTFALLHSIIRTLSQSLFHYLTLSCSLFDVDNKQFFVSLCPWQLVADFKEIKNLQKSDMGEFYWMSWFQSFFHYCVVAVGAKQLQQSGLLGWSNYNDLAQKYVMIIKDWFLLNFVYWPSLCLCKRHFAPCCTTKPNFRLHWHLIVVLDFQARNCFPASNYLRRAKAFETSGTEPGYS